jgi:hypothetical protein
MVETYSELEAKPTFHTCNINAVGQLAPFPVVYIECFQIASMLQSKAEKRFNVTFETVAGFEDFAQKVNFCILDIFKQIMFRFISMAT